MSGLIQPFALSYDWPLAISGGQSRAGGLARPCWPASATPVPAAPALRCRRSRKKAGNAIRDYGKKVTDLAADTRLSAERGQHRYSLELSRDWNGFGPLGGYLASIAIRAAGLDSGRALPASLQCTFPHQPVFEPIILTDMLQFGAALASSRSGEFVPVSLDLAVHFHQPCTDSDWLLVEAESPVARAGLVNGRAAIWSADGSVTATGSQQMLCRPLRK